MPWNLVWIKRWMHWIDNAVQHWGSGMKLGGAIFQMRLLKLHKKILLWRKGGKYTLPILIPQTLCNITKVGSIAIWFACCYYCITMLHKDFVFFLNVMKVSCKMHPSLLKMYCFYLSCQLPRTPWLEVASTSLKVSWTPGWPQGRIIN